ncbi:MAG: hypothetical protein ABL872_14560 [Lacibacter sp.]
MKISPLLVMLAFCLGISGCKKYKCEGDCETVIIKGRVFEAANNNGCNNVKVHAKLYQRSSCIFCNDEIIGTVKTNRDGTFELKTKLNPVYFSSQYLGVFIDVPDGLADDLGISSNSKFSMITFYDYDVSKMQTLKYPLYKRTTAAITIKNIQQSSFSTLSLDHYFSSNLSFADIIGRPASSGDTTIIITTAADVFTKLKLRKVISPGFADEVIDSAKFSTNASSNKFELGY